MHHCCHLLHFLNSPLGQSYSTCLYPAWLRLTAMPNHFSLKHSLEQSTGRGGGIVCKRFFFFFLKKCHEQTIELFLMPALSHISTWKFCNYSDSSLSSEELIQYSPLWYSTKFLEKNSALSPGQRPLSLGLSKQFYYQPMIRKWEQQFIQKEGSSIFPILFSLCAKARSVFVPSVLSKSSRDYFWF